MKQTYKPSFLNMYRKWYLPISAFLIIALAVFFNYYEDTKNSIQVVSIRKYVHDLKLVERINFSIASTDEIFYNNHIFFKDYANQQIIKTDLKGNILNTYGKRGESPKENIMIRGFFVDQDSYYTSDAVKNVISKITFQDSLLYYFKPDFQIGISGFLKNDKLIIKGSKVSEGVTKIVFYFVDPINNIKKEIDVSKFYDVTMNYSDLIFDGFFASTPDGGLIYVPHYNNQVIKFNSYGEIEYGNKLIYDVPFLELNIKGSVVFPSGNDNPHFYSISTNENFYFIQSSIGDKRFGNQTMIVDMYEISTGKYYSSLKIPINDKGFFPNTVRAYHNNLYIFYDEYFEIHKII